MINIFKLILLLCISAISVKSYSVVDFDKVEANEEQMIETLNTVQAGLSSFRDALNNYQDNAFMSKSDMEKILQDLEAVTSSFGQAIPKIAFEIEKDVDDMGGVTVISNELCTPEVLEFAPPFILTICAEYNNSRKTTGYTATGEVLWCVVEGEYHIPKHCQETGCALSKLRSTDLPMPPPDTCPNETLASYENRIAQEMERGGDLDLTEHSRRLDCHYGKKLLNNNSLANIDAWMVEILATGGDFEKFNQLDNLYHQRHLLPLACKLKKCSNAATCNSIEEQILEYLLGTGNADDVSFEGDFDLVDFVVNKFK